MKTLREIIANLVKDIITEVKDGRVYVGLPEEGFPEDQAEQAIKDLLLSKLPEKKYVSEDEDPAKAYDDLVHQGYNQAIDEVEKVIEEL